MKSVLFSMVALMLLLSLPAAAAEAPAVETPVIFKADHAALLETIRVTASGGELVSKPGDVFTTGGNYADVALPYLISTPDPIRYPSWAVRRGWQGEFSIAIEVKTDGTVGRYKVMKSTGHSLLDEAATKAVLGWIFQPAMRDGQAIVTCVQIPVLFELETRTHI